MDVYQMNDTDWTLFNLFYRSSRWKSCPQFEYNRTSAPRRYIESLILSWCELVRFTSSGTNFAIHLRGKSQFSCLLFEVGAQIDDARECVDTNTSHCSFALIQKCITYFRFRFSLRCMPCVRTFVVLRVITINSLSRLAPCHKYAEINIKAFKYANNDFSEQQRSLMLLCENNCCSAC